MKEIGIITKIVSPKLAEVTLSRSDACAKCCACKPLGKDRMAVEAHNGIGARLSQRVEIELRDKDVLKTYIVVFLLPVVFLLIGFVLGAWLWGEAQGVAAALFSLFLSFLFIRWYDRHAKTPANILRILD